MRVSYLIFGILAVVQGGRAWKGLVFRGHALQELDDKEDFVVLYVG